MGEALISVHVWTLGIRHLLNQLGIIGAGM